MPIGREQGHLKLEYELQPQVKRHEGSEGLPCAQVAHEALQHRESQALLQVEYRFRGDGYLFPTDRERGRSKTV